MGHNYTKNYSLYLKFKFNQASYTFFPNLAASLA